MNDTLYVTSPGNVADHNLVVVRLEVLVGDNRVVCNPALRDWTFDFRLICLFLLLELLVVVQLVREESH